MFSINEILKITKGRLLTNSHALRVKGISIDSRTVKKGELFIAIKGGRYDGHDFVIDAVKNGAAGVIISSEKVNSAGLSGENGRFIIHAGDTPAALGKLAGFHRNRFDIPVIAVTGSNGKTTTKEMLESILSDSWSPLKNQGTQNNLIGVSLTLLKLTDRNESAIMELGMNRRGEIKRLTEISRPNIGIITNIGPSHLEYLKRIKNVYGAKRELLDFLGRGDIAILNADDAFLRHFKKKGLKTVTFGINRKSDFKAARIKKRRDGLAFEVNGRAYLLKSYAEHNIYNALAVISAGTLFNVNPERMKEFLSNYVPLEGRMARSMFKGIEFIDDTYNSNPLSLESAVRTLTNRRIRGKKILVSGDMLELGRRAVYYHNKIGKIVANSGIDYFFGVGELSRGACLSAKKSGMKNARFYPSKDKAVAALKKIARSNDVVLVKGSRATRMEEVIKCCITSSIR
ncbi:MAG: UDP-N-acetylmuramoyl-tripeptide--D-alanyl-D-alanine ligase [Candidatus Omnitrophota bacterium]|nr:UDP-N-acetylmuramoyl-tripeptide--D-alanyl-D-alanine ligase [Candidatus Omnitrophota bacterium]